MRDAPMTRLDALKRGFVGRPLASGQLGETELPKTLALPVFCSDPLSSVAYATEAIVAILAYGGLSFYGVAPWLAATVALLLIVVVASYRQTIYAYPNGGGAYTVSRDNLGLTPSLVAAAALLVDYVMTVAVSVAAGVTALTSQFSGLLQHQTLLAVGFTLLLTLVNLRGVKESGKAFAIPTYGFVLGIYVMFGWAFYKIYVVGEPFRAVSADYHVVPGQLEKTGGLLTLLLVLRAFANGCTALTGVEAISNGVPAFRKPKAANAANTLAIMAFFSVTMFVGITVLALRAHVRIGEAPAVFGLSSEPSALSQIARATFGPGSPAYSYITFFTAGILILAANTAFNGFPQLASILARDRFLPRQLHNRGDRLVFSNGILILSGAAIALLIGFSANVATLLQLYIVGVFVSFTLSQTGMIRHWNRVKAGTAVPPAGLDPTTPAGRARLRRSQSINAIGAAFTGLVLLVVLYAKFTHGAYIAIAAMAVLFMLMRSIHRHYDQVSAELAPTEEQLNLALPARVRAVVLVSKIHGPTLRALAFARATRPHSLVALTVQVDADEAQALQREWAELNLPVDLVTVTSPYREVTRPVMRYVRELRQRSPRDVVEVYIPEYVVGRWWEQLLHNQSALRLKGRLLYQPNVMVTSVPYQLQSGKRRAQRLRDQAQRRRPLASMRHGQPAGARVSGSATPAAGIAVGNESGAGVSSEAGQAEQAEQAEQPVPAASKRP